jgi:hypothetical protein
MTSIDILRKQLAWVHDGQEATVGDVTDEAAHFSDTGKALPVGAAYAHSVISEDVIVQGMLAHKKPLSADNPDTGLSEPMPTFSDWDKYETWIKNVKVDLVKFRVFAKEVYAASDAYFATLKDEDLEKEIDLGPMGKESLLHILSTYVILHIANLTGEVSAAKGIQGLKGYPF